jgi:hypothetical protein
MAVSQVQHKNGMLILLLCLYANVPTASNHHHGGLAPVEVPKEAGHNIKVTSFEEFTGLLRSRFAGNRYRQVEQIGLLFHLKNGLQFKDCGGGCDGGWYVAYPQVR